MFTPLATDACYIDSCPILTNQKYMKPPEMSLSGSTRWHVTEASSVGGLRLQRCLCSGGFPEYIKKVLVARTLLGGGHSY